MKKLISALTMFIAACGASLASPAHPLPTVDGKINYSEVVVVDDASKDELYSRAKLWIASTFGSADSLILDDRENGVLLSNGRLEVRENEVGVRSLVQTKPTVVKTWTFTAKIQVREGRYKVELYDIEYTFAMPGNNVGHAPIPRRLDVLFLDKSMYKRDGSLKSGAPTNIANWTNEHFNTLMRSLRKALTEKVVVDDF